MRQIERSMDAILDLAAAGWRKGRQVTPGAYGLRVDSSPRPGAPYACLMHIRRLHATVFKSFADLEIELPTTPNLVVLCGENGTGKSSVIDALASWRLRHSWGINDPSFFAKGGDPSAGPGNVVLDFHEAIQGDPRALVYVRTAQRVTVDFQASAVGRVEEPLAMPGPMRTIDIDDRVTEDYQRLVARSIEALWDEDRAEVPAGQIVQALVGEIQGPLERLLPGLRFAGPDYPLAPQATLRFSKGSALKYAYKNLSGGEKAVFDLLLDVVAKRKVFGQAIWCIDEPELHVNPRIQGALLRELSQLLGADAQLWIATHSPGMLAEARTQHDADPLSVAFLDFAGLNPDEPVSLKPASPGRAFWRAQLSVAIGDLAKLIAPERVVLCEGSPDARDQPRARWDQRVLDTIFGERFPTVAFVSVGNSDDVVGDRMDLAQTVEALVDGVETLRVIDRDARSEQEVEDLRQRGCRVLSRRHLEAYLMDPEVLDRLCDKEGKPELKEDLRTALGRALQASADRGNAADDYKSASSELVTNARRLLGLTAGGNAPPAFLRDTLAPLLAPGMGPYEQLREDVFGGAGASS